jgi:hypothetical protein
VNCRGRADIQDGRKDDESGIGYEESKGPRDTQHLMALSQRPGDGMTSGEKVGMLDGVLAPPAPISNGLDQVLDVGKPCVTVTPQPAPRSMQWSGGRLAGC